jgi:hypothetical protein
VFTIEVTPSSSVLNIGGEQALIAVARFSDGNNVEATEDVSWSSDNSTIASIDNTHGSKGLVSGLEVGVTNINAELNGQLFDNVAQVEVQQLTLQSIDITPDNVTATQESNVLYQAIALYTNGSQGDITDQVIWESSDTGVAKIGNSIDDKGVASTDKNKDGTTTITATDPNININASTSLTVDGNCGNNPPGSVSVTPNPASVSTGGSIQMILFADFSGCIRNVTRASSTNWQSSNQSVATIEDDGIATGLSATAVSLGVSNIEGKYKGVTNTAPLTVIAEEVARVEISPTGPLLISVGNSADIDCSMQQIINDILQATEDITEIANWQVIDTSIISLGANGPESQIINANAIGSTVVSCNYGGKTTSLTIVVE